MAAGKAAYAALEPSNLLNKHAWLFRDSWVEESADEVEDIEEIDFQKRDEWIRTKRVDAMSEIRDQLGLPALLELAERGKASWEIGFYAVRELLSSPELVEFLRLALRPMLDGKELTFPSKNVIGGVLRATRDLNRECVLEAISADLSEEDRAKLLLLAPFNKGTWKMVDALGEEAQAKYWSDVGLDSVYDADAENNERVERLLTANRPRRPLHASGSTQKN